MDRLSDTERKASIVELINPVRLPEAAFQSYEKLTNNSVQEREPFLNGASRNPDFRYNNLRELSDMDQGILKLAETLEDVDRLEPNEKIREVIKSSLRYRIAEMEYIKKLGQLDYVFHETGDREYLAELVSEVTEASEALYGEVDPTIRDASLNSVWQKISTVSWHGKARQLADDLEHGFVSAEGFVISPMRRADDPEARFPEFDESTEWAGEHFQEKNADIQMLLQEFWDNKVPEHGEDYACMPSDIAEAFRLAFQYRDPENRSGVRVILAEGKTALSWESPQMAVLVGGDRAPIPTPEMLFTRYTHEGGHGEKTINGLKTDVPVLGLGMYTDTPNPDYLTFEEGYLTVIESAMDGSQLPWQGAAMNYTLGIAFAAEGDDFRNVFEKTWRYNLLQEIDDDTDVTDEMMQKARTAAYTSTVRIFRGTPTALGEQLQGAPVPTYNKDLAYLRGKVIAMEYIKQAFQGKDTGMLDFAMMGKFDPTNPLQAEIARDAFTRAGML